MDKANETQGGTNASSYPCVAIIVAAGSGSRYGGSLPKQFCTMNGRPVLTATIEAFRRVLPPENIRVVVSADMTEFWASQCREAGFESPPVVSGGGTRWESVKNAVESLNELPHDTVVLIHDGARPLVSESLIRRAANLQQDSDANIPAIAVSDSLREKDRQGEGSRSVERSRFVAVQTPQSSTLRRLRAAYALPYLPELTDDASVLERAGYNRITLIQGDPQNIKITNPGDVAVAEVLENLTKC